MAEKRAGVERRWTPHEDQLLYAAVARFTEHDNWKSVAELIPNRSNKACRKRWLHSLSPTIKKSGWTDAEDRLLVDLFNTHGPKWALIARFIEGRTDDACSKRYREALDPTLSKAEWTPAEDAKLLEVVARLGSKWGQVGHELRRSGLGCRNRHRLIERNRLKAERESLEQPVAALYCPPEVYPTPLGSELPLPLFRAPTPEMPHKSPPMPFNYSSSSSLSAALSDPPRRSVPLPPIPDGNMPMEEFVETWPFHGSPFTSPPSLGSTPELVASISPSSTPASMSPNQDPLPLDRMSQSTISPSQMFLKSPNIPRPRPPRRFTPVLAANHPVRPPDVPDGSNWPQPLTDSLLFSSGPTGVSEWPASVETVPISVPLETPSSSCSPAAPPSSLSPSESPKFSTLEELPPSTPFLPLPEHPPPDAPRRHRRRAAGNTKPVGETRLSCRLPTSSDPDLCAYACGREPCWPEGAAAGSVCFSTSKELLDHARCAHDDELDEELNDKSKVHPRPYRCALAGCGKSWKTLNGLQYHLQISTAHFRNAVSSEFRSKDEKDDDEDNERSYICPHDQCFKAYRHPSGLRYHLKHGHSAAIQLETVPPSLARELEKKTRKMRRKDDF
uniref:Uncharacterized protein n=1 Tax=Mycena chlorophos TaxID=658473 RepID=A0ABQ0KZF2_MYCCL|nr:predicted protein [Mycena chlorophos]